MGARKKGCQYRQHTPTVRATTLTMGATRCKYRAFERVGRGYEPGTPANASLQTAPRTRQFANARAIYMVPHRRPPCSQSAARATWVFAAGCLGHHTTSQRNMFAAVRSEALFPIKTAGGGTFLAVNGVEKPIAMRDGGVWRLRPSMSFTRHGVIVFPEWL